MKRRDLEVYEKIGRVYLVAQSQLMASEMVQMYDMVKPLRRGDALFETMVYAHAVGFYNGIEYEKNRRKRK